jgi:membrane-bound metal-dependent hydrolase YbcI (DUF457 family)
MSGIGHFAAGLALKPVTPKTPLWVLLAAGEINDVLYFFFSSFGLEQKAAASMDFSRGVHYLTTSSNPWSHGLFMSLVWASLAVALAFLYYRDRRTAFTLGLVVFSHWVLDFIMHSNLPVFFGASPLIGLGLENTGPGFLLMTIIDILLVAGGMGLYFSAQRLQKRAG